jgi:hypothetical protein
MPRSNIRKKMAFNVIVIFTAPDGKHVGRVEFQEPPHMVDDATVERHVRKHFEQRSHTKVVEFWRQRHEADLAETKARILSENKGRESVADLTGDQPTRILVDAELFGRPNDDDAAGDNDGAGDADDEHDSDDPDR